MASGRFKDLSKGLHAVFASPITPYPLPDDLQQTIQAYLERHDKNEESDASRLQEELLDIHSKYVVKDENKLETFLQLLRSLSSAITGPARKTQWWNTVIQSVLNDVGHKRDEIEHAGEFLLSALDYDADDDKDGDLAKESSRLAKLLLNVYLKRTKPRDTEDDLPTQEDEFVAHQLEHVLVGYGRKKPKDLMNSLAGLVHDARHRTQALNLLCSFVRHQPPHLYTISDTPLLDNLLKCLLIDTSATSVQLALTCLIMFMPHIPGAVALNLPRLFLIYSRLLCWDRLFLAPRMAEPPSEEMMFGDDMVQVSTSPPRTLDPTWQRMGPSPEVAETLVPNLTYYFTFLYGLYPLNFMNYIRTPKEHLKDAGFANAEDYDLVHTIISQRTEQFQRSHLVHPNFCRKTRQEELSDDRWLKTDPADVVAECIGLRVEGHLQLRELGPPSTSKPPDVPGGKVKTEDIPTQSLLNSRDEESSDKASPQVLRALPGSAVEPFSLSRKNSQRSTRTPASQSSAFSSPALRSRTVDDSPMLAPAFSIPARVAAHHSNGSDSSFHSADDNALSDGELSTTLKQSTFHHSPAARPAPPPDANSAYLQREVLLLKNDLNFERYLKQQHLSHIGHLQRRHIRDATREAEQQNLMQTTKTLRARVEKANASYLALKKETADDREKSRAQQSSLTMAVRSLREDEQRWRAEEENLRLDLKKVQRDCEHLRQLVVESEAKDLLAQQKVAQMEIELETVATLRQRVRELEARVRDFEAREILFEQAGQELEIARTELATASLQLQSRDGGLDRAKRQYERRIVELEGKVAEMHNPASDMASGGMHPGIQKLIDIAVAPKNTAILGLKKEVAVLRFSHAQLEAKHQELEQNSTSRSTRVPPSHAAAVEPGTPHPGTRPQRSVRRISLESGDVSPSALLKRYGGSAPSTYLDQLSVGRDKTSVQVSTPYPLYQQVDDATTSMSSSAPASVKHAPFRPPNHDAPIVGVSSAGGGSTSLALHREDSARSDFGRSTGRKSDADGSIASFGAGGSGPSGTSGSGFYRSSQSAFSHDTLGDGETEASSKGGKASGGGGGVGVGGSSIFGRVTGHSVGGGSKSSKKDDAETKKDWRSKNVRKVGSLRGIRGII